MTRGVDFNAVSNAAAVAVLDTGRLGELLAGLGLRLDVRPGQEMHRAGCPLHVDDRSGLVLRTGGHTLPVRWACSSRHWERTYKPSLLGLVRALLTVRQGKDSPVPILEAVDYLERFVGRRLRPVPQFRPLTREEVRSRLVIPSRYFLTRGFSARVLDALDVGYSPLRRKTVVPLYDETGEVCVSYLERSEKPPCDKCRKCHEPGQECRYGQPRWCLPRDAPRRGLLYGHANALRSQAPFVFLVEGPADVFKLVEAGYAAVAPLGTELYEAQVEKLAALGKGIVISFDNDAGGRAGAPVALRRLSGRVPWVRSLPVPPQYKDVGAMPGAEVERWVRGRSVTFAAA